MATRKTAMAAAEPPKRQLTKPEQAMRMYAHGHRPTTIALVLETDLRTVRQWILETLPDVGSLDTIRRVELARLDMYLEVLEARIERGDDKAVNAALRVSERRAHICGSDMPIKIDSTVQEITAQDAELRDLIAEAQAKTAADEARLLRELQGDDSG